MHRRKPSRRVFLRKCFASAGAACAFPHTFHRLPAAQPIPAPQVSSVERQARVATGTRGVVATVHHLASQAAMDAFADGGNAIDAAIAASCMLSVVDGHNSGIGGGCLALVRLATGEVRAIDGRETAPQSARPEMFYSDGQPNPQLSRVGPLAAGVPGLLAALKQMHDSFGTRPLAAAFAGAAQVAEQGFVITDDYARVLRSVANELKRFPSTAAILLDSGGNPWPSGTRLIQQDLATTFRNLERSGLDWFYQGDFARRVADYMASQGGLLTRDDFARYSAVERPPIKTVYRENQVIGFPPPSSGGIHIAQMLGMLSHFDVTEIFERSPSRGLHLLLEVMKRAMADRAYWLGDADFAQVPKGLLDKPYLAERMRDIDLTRATPVASHGQPPRADLDLFGQQKHTTHLTTADSEGNVVALTQTVNTSFGCKMIVPGTGVVLNNEMDDFSIAPGVRNAFGLVGSDANLIAPGKRPLSSMSPTIVVDEAQQPILSCGAAGGPKIITSVLQILVRVLDLGEDLESALAAPRIHHQWSPDRAVCEEQLPLAIRQQLSALGHDVQTISRAAVSQGLTIAGDGRLQAAADPRVPSSALGL